MDKPELSPSSGELRPYGKAEAWVFGDMVVPIQKEVLVQALLLLVDEYGAL